MTTYTMWKNKHILLCTLLLSLTVTESKAALTQDEIDHRRSELQNSIDHSSIGSSYAYILNFFIEPDISASTYDVDDDANTRIDIYKFPLQKDFLLNADGWKIALRGIISYATLEMTQNVFETETIDSKWKAYSGSVGTGLLVPIVKDLTLITAADIGLSHMNNDSKYNGLLGASLGRYWMVYYIIGTLTHG